MMKAFWRFARDNGYVLVSKDIDFYERTLLSGSPPKLIWIRTGNCSTRDVENLLRNSLAAILQFEKNHDDSLLVLS